MPTETRTRAADLHRALRQVVRIQALRDRVRAATRGLTAAAAHALEVLAEQGPLSLSALAAALFVDRSTACRTVGLLEDRGLLVRRADEHDGRAIRVELTAAGRALEAPLRAEALRDADAALGTLPAAEREAGLAFLRHLADAAASPASGADRLLDRG
ncbi:MAG TPA: MarR family transcriptional regulator [Longimicrobium sp.]|nr:MarR family transcriptional regulator [Longimicrobium sp.]